jgi:O-acetyl-ADP-ribose deacetylase (regulator of RNase III)
MITQGYHLPARYVITTVGPIYESHEKSSPLLIKAYVSCLEIAKHNRIQSLVFPSISTGLFRYPINDAALIAVKTVISWLKSDQNQHGLRLIIFNTFDDQTTDIYRCLVPLMRL